MRYLEFKEGVRLKKWTPELARILEVLLIVQNIKVFYPDFVVTSVNDSQHGEGSRHYTDEAVDIRAHNFLWKEHKNQFISDMQFWLGPLFTVLHEDVGTVNEHFHIQVAKGVKYGGI